MRILFHSDDSWNAGHVRRTVNVAGRLLREFPQTSGPVLTGPPRALIFSRLHPRLEQQVRALRLAHREAVEVLPDGATDTAALARTLLEAFGRPRPPRDLQGLDRIAADLAGLLRARRPAATWEDQGAMP
ncbi:MAG TPA: hypothetical protein ENK10_00630 [Acidobacteria bacterium]|nr:hypothetical protein [Acidobacteriota bacterium]